MRILRVFTKLTITTYIALVNLVFCYIFYFMILVISFFILPKRYSVYIDDLFTNLKYLNPLEITSQNLLMLSIPIIIIVLYFLYCISPLNISRIRKALGCVEPKGYELKRLSRLMLETGIGRVFKLYLQVDNELNASAFGTNSIGVTSKMMSEASDAEIKGVICHEYGHILHNDFTYRMGMHTFEQLGKLSLYRIFYVIDKTFKLLFFIWYIIPLLRTIVEFISNLWWIVYWIVAVLIYGLSNVLQANLNKYSEYRCDRYALHYGHGEGLLLLLKRIKEYEDVSPKMSLFDRLICEHPSTKNRIYRLEKMMDERYHGIQNSL